MPSNHALLGPSSSHRWLVCTPSARLEEQFPNTTSKYAEEGTLAHSLCEAKLRRFLGNDVEIPTPANKEMDVLTTAYADFVEEELNAAKASCPGAALLVEQEFDISEYVPEGFGTSDAVIVADNVLTVIDFKYGMGVQVEAYENTQLKLYALGSYVMLESLYQFNEIRMIIYQPRIGNISEDTISVKDLLDWAENCVKPQAKAAFNGEGECVSGDHCKFCRAGAVCKARAESIFPVFKHEKITAPILSDAELPSLMQKFDETRSWMDAVESYALKKALDEGYQWEGFKLVESDTKRKIVDQIEAGNRLKSAGYNPDEYTNVKLKGITDLERVVGKKKLHEMLDDLIVKPAGVPTLVPNSDKRKAISSRAEIVFKED